MVKDSSIAFLIAEHKANIKDLTIDDLLVDVAPIEECRMSSNVEQPLEDLFEDESEGDFVKKNSRAVNADDDSDTSDR